jgi:hypothetical protein
MVLIGFCFGRAHPSPSADAGGSLALFGAWIGAANVSLPCDDAFDRGLRIGLRGCGRGLGLPFGLVAQLVRAHA